MSLVSRFLALLVGAVMAGHALGQGAPAPAQAPEGTVYLFTSFRGNGESGLYLLHSRDGYRWTDLGRSFLTPRVGGRLMRDPSLCLGPDGLYHMVWTSSWTDRGFGYASSKDLVHWSEQQFIEIWKSEPTVKNTWAPEIRWLEDKKQYLIYWSTTIPGRYPGDDSSGYNHRMYYTTTPDFKDFAPPKLMLEPGFTCIDGVILDRLDNRWLMVFKDERNGQKRLKAAWADEITGPYGDISAGISPVSTEGPTPLKIGNEWFVYFDFYTAGRYGAIKSGDLKNWTDVSNQMSFPRGHRHGTVFAAPEAILQGLQRP
jgi:beta-xylosidase